MNKYKRFHFALDILGLKKHRECFDTCGINGSNGGEILHMLLYSVPKQLAVTK